MELTIKDKYKGFNLVVDDKGQQYIVTNTQYAAIPNSFRIRRITRYGRTREVLSQRYYLVKTYQLTILNPKDVFNLVQELINRVTKEQGNLSKAVISAKDLHIRCRCPISQEPLPPLVRANNLYRIEVIDPFTGVKTHLGSYAREMDKDLAFGLAKLRYQQALDQVWITGRKLPGVKLVNGTPFEKYKAI